MAGFAVCLTLTSEEEDMSPHELPQLLCASQSRLYWDGLVCAGARRRRSCPALGIAVPRLHFRCSMRRCWQADGAGWRVAFEAFRTGTEVACEDWGLWERMVQFLRDGVLKQWDRADAKVDVDVAAAWHERPFCTNSTSDLEDWMSIGCPG